jgi:hypothetical protein
MVFGSPYGATFGLGQALANVPNAYLQGQQIAQENAANQLNMQAKQQQMNQQNTLFQQQQAQQQKQLAMQQELQGANGDLDKIAQININHGNIPGYQEAINAQQTVHQQLTTSAVKSVLASDGNINPEINKAINKIPMFQGYEYTGATKDKDGDIDHYSFQKTDPMTGKTITQQFSRSALAMMGENLQQGLAYKQKEDELAIMQQQHADILKHQTTQDALKEKHENAQEKYQQGMLGVARENATTKANTTGGELTPEARVIEVEKFIKTGKLDSDISQRYPAERLKIINAAAEKITQEGRPVDLSEQNLKYKAAGGAYKYWTIGAGATAFRQQETIQDHIKTLKDIVNKLDNGDVQGANKLSTMYGVQFGNNAPTNYKIAAGVLSKEVGKYLSGTTSSKAERSELQELLPVINSPSQFKGGLDTLDKLIQGQRKNWTEQRNMSLREEIPFSNNQPSGKSDNSNLSSNSPSKTPTQPLSKFHINKETGQIVGWNGSNWVDTKTGVKISSNNTTNSEPPIGHTIGYQNINTETA